MQFKIFPHMRNCPAFTQTDINTDLIIYVPRQVKSRII